MSIKQTITYNSQNKYFAGFLNHILQEVKLEGSVEQKNGKIILLIDDKDQKKLESFSKIVTKYLPHSIFLGEIETLVVDEIAYQKPFQSPTYDIALCPRCLEDLTRPSSDKYLDDTVRCNHYSNETVLDKPDYTLYSPHYSACCTILLCDASKVDELFIMTDDEKKVLFSIEKPTIRVTIKDEILKEMTGKTYINVKSPYNVKSSLAALNAEDSEIDYLFFEDTNETKVVVVQKNISIIRDNKISTKLIKFDERDDINRFLNIANSIGNKNDAISAYLSVKNGISFMVSNDAGCQKAICIQQFSLETLLKDMKNDDRKSKLLENFSKKYQNIIDQLNSDKTYDLFATLSIILELDEKSFESLSDKSLEFRGNGGLKIDMNYLEDRFDYVSFIGSIMSFKLASTDNHYLAYSIFEAFGDMAISTLNQLKDKFKIDNFIMMGDMFDNSVLYSRILSKFSISKPHFSNSYPLDD
jgi:hydrogenase maturation factor HypF (carbamoyltransferase family)